MTCEWAMRYLEDMEPLRAEEEMRMSRIVSMPHMSDSHRRQVWSEMQRQAEHRRRDVREMREMQPSDYVAGPGVEVEFV